MESKNLESFKIPIILLRDIVVYPYIVIPLFIGRENSVQSLEVSKNYNKQVILVAQKDSFKDSFEEENVFSIGTVSSILNVLKLPDGTFKILVEGKYRAKILSLKKESGYILAEATIFGYTDVKENEKDAFHKIIIDSFKEYIQYSKKISSEVLISLNFIHKLDKLINTIAFNIPLKVEEKQKFLEINDISQQFEYLVSIMKTEIKFLEIEERIRNRIKEQIERNQREYYLNEQIKAIQKELCEIEEFSDEYSLFKKRIENAKMPKNVRLKVESELNKLRMMPSISAEATVLRNYIDWMIQVPWSFRSKMKKNLSEAKKKLDNDHYGLKFVKERILEYLAVQSRNKKVKGSILCLIGPPGVGKTSLGKSIAKAVGRRYIRVALGGLRDEAEIRGHRKTYIGSMPGKIIQKITKIGVKNPLFLLDEIDKISSDIRGDPGSALLEVLDSEQNSSFNDHYLEVDYDLSDVMFIATSNSMNIPSPLLDRMEIIKLSGYTEDEKFNIAKKHLLPKQIKRNALNKNELIIDDSVIASIIRYYTKESGVRCLEREISKLCRKAVKEIVMNKTIKSIYINDNNLEKYLGIKKFNFSMSKNYRSHIGKVIGLAWTENGGDVLTIEVVCVPGKGKLIYTGSLGEIMKESIQIALTVVRSRSNLFSINNNIYEKRDIHVHIPEGSTPKDGPSAGISVCTALISCLTKRPIKSNIAMTGEVTLHGTVLPIGGLKEKLLAAYCNGIKVVIIPFENQRNLKDIPERVIQSLEIILVQNIDEVFKFSLCNFPFNL